MSIKSLPLKELSIAELYNGNKVTYEVPIYQRNYAWEKDEIFTLIQDVYDSMLKNNSTYYIGTLVTYHKGDQVFEVIDGQQRLTTTNLILGALNIKIQNKLTYRARKKANDTILSIPHFQVDETEAGIFRGFRFALESIQEIVPIEQLDGFTKYFQNKVHIIHYQVPKDVDLNHYFEIMNSRGEQLEKHEIIKARLIEKLNDSDKNKFSHLWESCSEMGIYIQQKIQDVRIFGNHLNEFILTSFDEFPNTDSSLDQASILELIEFRGKQDIQHEKEKDDSFQAIIDFSNFLLIVLKITRLDELNFDPTNFNLDDKDLIHEFDKIKDSVNEDFVKKFAFNLLQAKFLLDNFMAHHSNEEDTMENNPWKLQTWYKDDKQKYLRNLSNNDLKVQQKLVQLLSMFEVSFTARQRKNYLLYCLLYLFVNKTENGWDVQDYSVFVSNLADKFLRDVYLVEDNLSEINVPKPGSFDAAILNGNQIDTNIHNIHFNFSSIYGDGNIESKGISLYIFNYLDFKIWEKYANELEGEKTVKGSPNRIHFFETLGCSDFDLKVLEQFYFSRTRRSLEHFYPQANATGENGTLNQAQINCFGNYAMIGSDANSSGSNWSPKAKLDHYLDSSGKIKQVSVASLKFMIMMQRCKDNSLKTESGQEWNFDDITNHQNRMLGLMIGS